jgi:ABC-2 type transport system ATP-binding protein
VQSVAAFGTSLHVTATDPAALQAALAPLQGLPDVQVRPAEPNLEDVFISLIGQARDNYAPP